MPGAWSVFNTPIIHAFEVDDELASDVDNSDVEIVSEHPLPVAKTPGNSSTPKGKGKEKAASSTPGPSLHKAGRVLPTPDALRSK